MNVLDVYRPQSAEGKLPVIVSVHGGGWMYGDKKLYSLTKIQGIFVNVMIKITNEVGYEGM